MRLPIYVCELNGESKTRLCFAFTITINKVSGKKLYIVTSINRTLLDSSEKELYIFGKLNNNKYLYIVQIYLPEIVVENCEVAFSNSHSKIASEKIISKNNFHNCSLIIIIKNVNGWNVLQTIELLMVT